MPWSRKKATAKKSYFNRAPAIHAVERKPLVGTEQQEEIWDRLSNDDSHQIIRALAGTGKTTTLVEGLHRMKENGFRGTATFVAYNRAIANELERRVPAGFTASTLHRLGLQSCRSAFGKVSIVESKLDDILLEYYGSFEAMCDKLPLVDRMAVLKLTRLCKDCLVGEAPDFRLVPEDILTLAELYDVDLSDNVPLVTNLVSMLLKVSFENTNSVDFDDMIWLPVAYDIPMSQVDVVMVDESQDLNRSRQQLVLKAGRRIIACGDPNQAIYGFSGADVQSMDTLGTLLQGYREKDVVNSKLTYTRRCPKVVVKEAQSIVPDFEALPDAPEGKLFSGTEADMYRDAQPGDMVVCRTNAPVVSMAFRLLADNRRAVIQGRDIGKDLVRIAKSLGGNTVADMEAALTKYHNEQTARISARRKNRESRLQVLDDKVHCLRTFLENAEGNVNSVIQKLESLFTEQENTGDQITLSSIHKAKGLEANRVHFLLPNMIPLRHTLAKDAPAWMPRQEYNLKYVAITRSKDCLRYAYPEDSSNK